MLWNNGHEVRATMQSEGRTDGNPRKVTSPARQTPPSGWPGQVKMLGGVSLCLKIQRGVPSLADASSWAAEDSEHVGEQAALYTCSIDGVSSSSSSVSPDSSSSTSGAGATAGKSFCFNVS